MIQLFAHEYTEAYFSIEWWDNGPYIVIIHTGNENAYWIRPHSYDRIEDAESEGNHVLNEIHARYGKAGDYAGVQNIPRVDVHDRVLIE